MDSQITTEEKQFLEAIALRLTLTGDTLAVFLARFSRENATRENSNLVSLIAWNNSPADPNQKIQDELKKICDILEKDDCPIVRPDGQKKRGRAPKGQSPWKQANKWLWESRFPEWQRDNQWLVSGQEETGRNGQADIDALVQQVRSRLLPFITAPYSHIGTMRMLSVNRPVPVEKIYIDLNVLEQLSCSSHFSNWRQEFDPNKRQDFDRLGLSRVQKRVEALSAVKDCPKLMVLGKPGAGKTTFLKSLAVECIQPQTELFANLVPLFVTLRDFAKEARTTQSWKLSDYLTCLLAERWNGCDRASAEKILTQGRSLVLLDGLDEVPPEDLENLLDAVREFGYTSNRLIITCRTQSQQNLDGFTDVEVADFTPEQVDRFVDNLFKIVDSDSQTSLAPQLQQQLRATENKAIAELTITPVLLDLICVVFRDQKGNLPKKRFELYTKGMRKLLERMEWRKLIDERLTIDTKEKFLADLALMLFEKNDYFPEQQTLENFIRNYFRVERPVATKILKAFETETGLLIERSAGYWSFSHLTFHEYFTALKVSESNDLEIKQRLNRYILEKRWHEVFLLIAERNGNE
jgi:predicted NACHT family NTPase